MTAALFPRDTETDRLLVGPDSMAWRAVSDVRLNLAMLYPLLLQVAHPTVDAGVADYSDFEKEPWKRLLRTLDYVYLLVYGGRNAIAAGRRVRALHKRFRGVREDGARYSALEPRAYAWVHATLIDTYVRAHGQFGSPMSADETDRFYREYRGLGRLIGVREDDLPADWYRFCAYFSRTARYQLRRTASVDRVLNRISDTPRPPLPMAAPVWRAMKLPARRAVWLGGIGLMDPWLRRRLGMGWSAIDDAEFRVLGAVSRGLTPVLPASFKVTGLEYLRARRDQIAHGPLAI
jgi:uncharacterized protein (DUF2236 family)